MLIVFILLVAKQCAAFLLISRFLCCFFSPWLFIPAVGISLVLLELLEGFNSVGDAKGQIYSMKSTQRELKMKTLLVCCHLHSLNMKNIRGQRFLKNVFESNVIFLQ